MTRRAAFLLPLLSALALAGEKKQIGPPSMGNDFVEIAVTPYVTRDDAAKALGADPGPGIVIMELKITPKLGKTLDVSPDDFTLLATNDGQRSGPYAPTQIAGSGSLVVHQQTGRTSGRFGNDNPNGPIIGGMPGTGSRPRQLPGNGGGVGNSSVTESDTQVRNQKSEANSPLLTVLKEKVLPTIKTDEPVGGLLYFPLDGKHKLKDLELLYKGTAGKLTLEFKR